MTTSSSGRPGFRSAVSIKDEECYRNKGTDAATAVLQQCALQYFSGKLNEQSMREITCKKTRVSDFISMHVYEMSLLTISHVVFVLLYRLIGCMQIAIVIKLTFHHLFLN